MKVEWEDVLEAFLDNAMTAPTSQLVIWIAVGGEDLAKLATFDYVQDDPNTWMSNDHIGHRVQELISIAREVLDRRVPIGI